MALLAVLLTLPVLVLTARDAHACSCVAGSVADRLADSDLVVEGVVTSVRTTAREREYTFTVQRWWKGPHHEVVTVSTRADSAECGRSFTGREPQVVLATGSGGSWRTDLCRSMVIERGSRIGEVTAAGVEQELGRGTPSGAEPGATKGDDVAVEDPSPWPGVAVGAAVVLLLVASGAVLLRRRG